VSGDLSYALQLASDVTTGERLSNAPVHMFRTGLAVPLPAGLELTAGLTFDDDRLSVLRSTIDSYFRADAGIRTPRIAGLIHGSVMVHNLTGAEYRTPGGFEHAMPGIVQDGRTLRIRLEMGR
jgi:hypothetical protein